MLYLKLFHLFFLFLWIGTLWALTWLVGRVEERRVLQKMYLFLDLPAMVLAFAMGITSLILYKMENLQGGWFHMKLTSALFLVIVDILTGRTLFALKKLLYTPYLKFLVLVFLFFTLMSIYVVKNRDGLHNVPLTEVKNEP